MGGTKDNQKSGPRAKTKLLTKEHVKKKRNQIHFSMPGLKQPQNTRKDQPPFRKNSEEKSRKKGGGGPLGGNGTMIEFQAAQKV